MRASSFYRYSLCPASYHRELALGPLPETETPEAESGTAIHAALAGLDHRPLTADEETVVERCWDMLSAYVQDFGDPSEEVIEGEMKIPAQFLKLGDLEITGHPDRVLIYLDQKLAVLPDWKSGYGEVPDADANLQIRLYVLMTKMRYGKQLERIDGLISKPRKSWQPDIVTYQGAETFKTALNEIRAIAQRALDADPEKDLHPSETACKYCPDFNCPARLQVVDQLATLAVAPDQWDTYPVAEKLSLWEKLGIAEKAIGTIRSRFKQDLAKNPDAYGGALYLREVNGQREISDPAAAFTAFAAEGVTAEQFAAACKVRITDLKTALRDAKRFEAWCQSHPEGPSNQRMAKWADENPHGTREEFLAFEQDQFAQLDPKELRKLDCLKGAALEKHFNALIDPLCDRNPRDPSVEVNKEKLHALL